MITCDRCGGSCNDKPMGREDLHEECCNCAEREQPCEFCQWMNEPLKA